jgi:hypothetical protein
MENLGRLPAVGDLVEFDKVKAEVTEVRGSRAHAIEIELPWDRSTMGDTTQGN